MKKSGKKQPPKPASIKSAERLETKTLKKGHAEGRLEGAKFGKDGCGY